MFPVVINHISQALISGWGLLSCWKAAIAWSKYETIMAGDTGGIVTVSLQRLSLVPDVIGLQSLSSDQDHDIQLKALKKLVSGSDV